MTKEIIFDTKNNLSVSVNQKHVLLNEPAFKRPEAYLHNIVVLSILNSYKHLNWAQPDIEDLNEMVKEIKFAIQNRYKQVRAEEIPDIFTDGIRKVYGEFMGLSIVSFEMFIIGYLESQKRKSLALSLPKPEETKTPSSDEIYQISKSNAVMALNEFKKNGSCGRFGSVVYQFFKDNGLINQTKEERIEYWERAKIDYQNYLKLAKKTSLSLEEKQRATKEYESFMEGGKKDRLIVISRRLVVDDYFLGLGNKDLNEIL